MSRSVRGKLMVLGLFCCCRCSGPDPTEGPAEAAATDAEPWVTYEGTEGPGSGRHIVLVSGDEEYRSEEALPMLARILAMRHGFKCTVLFAVDPREGFIDPNNQTNIPGLEALDSADLMILFTRFRELPDEQMSHIADFVESGKPIIGIRTATHAFNYTRDLSSPYARYDFRSEEWPGGFGRQILGETWISHHGRHKEESTRGIVNSELGGHPILRGVDDIWAPTDVYGVTDLPEGSRVLLWGQVLAGMKPEDPALEGAGNDPMMPLAWVREYPGRAESPSRVFCTTAGASVDLENEGLRRLLVNASYWGLGLEDEIPARSAVGILGDYEPTSYGFHSEEGYWRGRGLRPRDFELGK